VSAVEALFWVSLAWSVFYLYCAVDVPTLVGRWMRGHR
jgi:hypothetical protein